MHNSLLPRALNEWCVNHLEELKHDGTNWMLMSYGVGLWGLDFTGQDQSFSQGNKEVFVRLDLVPDENGMKLWVRQTIHGPGAPVENLEEEYRLDDEYSNPLELLGAITEGILEARFSCGSVFKHECAKCDLFKELSKTLEELQTDIKRSQISMTNFDWQEWADRFDEESEKASLNEFFDEYLGDDSDNTYFIAGESFVEMKAALNGLFMGAGIPATVELEEKSASAAVSIWDDPREYIMKVTVPGMHYSGEIFEIVERHHSRIREGVWIKYGKAHEGGVIMSLEPDEASSVMEFGLVLVDFLNDAWKEESKIMKYEFGKSKEFKEFKSGFLSLLKRSLNSEDAGTAKLAKLIEADLSWSK